jgi:Protein of unknown function (DUF3631)/Domain of unknown function (DUF3854)
MTATDRGLLPQHRQLIADSAISDTVATERGYFSVSAAKELNGMFGPSQRRAPALVIPVLNPYGERVFYQLRPDEPRVKDGRILKYETPARVKMTIDVPPSTRPHLANPKAPLWITEGIRKADSLASIGLHAVALLGVWNWRGKGENGGSTTLPDWEAIAFNDQRPIVICFDSDAFQNPGVHEATERLGRWLEHRGAEISFVYLPPAEDGSKIGVDDFLAAGNSKEDLHARVAREWRPLPSSATVASDKPPTGELLPTAQLIAEVVALIDRFIILPSRAAALAIALYALHTWAFEAAHATPYLVIRSPVKRAGKTRTEEVLELIVRAPWRIAAASESAMFRKIDSERPTLLLDEVDALFGAKAEGTEPVRAILNAGNRPGAAVSRVVGEGAGMTVADFSVYCPKVLAGINTARWPDTVIDRAITVQLRRKKPGESVQRFRHRKLHAETEPLRAALARWAHEHTAPLRDADPQIPGKLDDRAEEGWEPLLAIAELADHDGGEGWGERARRAAEKLAGERVEDEDAHGVLALTAIRGIFADAVALHTGPIVAKLNEDEQLPFGDYRKGAGLSDRGLAKLLKPFAITPHPVMIAGDQKRGYRRDQFVDAWERYCPTKSVTTRTDPPSDGSEASTRQAPNDHGGFGAFSKRQPERGLTDSETVENPDEHWALDGLTHQNGQRGGPSTNVANFDGSCDCSHADAHRDRWGPHPTSDRLVCQVCHPIPGTVA